jgi:hypothetical protein
MDILQSLTTGKLNMAEPQLNQPEPQLNQPEPQLNQPEPQLNQPELFDYKQVKTMLESSIAMLH